MYSISLTGFFITPPKSGVTRRNERLSPTIRDDFNGYDAGDNTSLSRHPATVLAAIYLLQGGAGLATALVGLGVLDDVAAQAGPPATTGEEFAPVEQLALEAIVVHQLAVQRVPGAVAGVWVPGRGVWSHADGIGDLRTAAPITSGDHFRIASVTKTFTATLVLQLVDEGRLRLDDSLEPFVPGIPDGREVTIRQ